MKYFVKLLSLCAFCCLLTATTAWSDNLLTNPGFESGVTGWNNLYGEPFWISNTVVHSGQYAAAKTITDVSTQDYWSQLHQQIDYSPGEMVYATLWVKPQISPLSTAKGGLLIQFLDSNNQIIGTLQDDVGGTTDWQLCYVSGPAPTGTAEVRFSGFVWAAQGDTAALNCSVYYDDAVLDTDYIAPPPPQTTIINPGFENGLNDWSDLYGTPAWVSTNIVHSGNYAAAKTITNVATMDYWSQLYQEVNISPPPMANAYIWAKTDFDPQSSAVARLRIEFLNQAGSIIGAKTSAALYGQSDWTRLHAYGFYPAGTVKVRFKAYVWAPQGDLFAVGGIAYFDDAILTFTSPYEPVTPYPVMN